MEDNNPISPETAAAVWQRAAQLQAEAAQRLEERSRALAAGSESDSSDPHNYSVDDVRAAAIEAGIAPEFVALAIAEQSADSIGPLPLEKQEVATRFLGTAERSLELSRVVDQPIELVFASLQRVLPAHPWLLSLREAMGDPANGGSLVFAIPAYMAFSTVNNLTPLSYAAHVVDVQQIQLMLRRIDDRSCEVLLRAGLERSVRRNFRFGNWTARIMAALGGTGAAGIALAAGVTSAVIVLPVAAGAALLGFGTAAGYRKAYRYYLEQFTTLMNEMLGAIAVDAKTGGAFVARPSVAPVIGPAKP